MSTQPASSFPLRTSRELARRPGPRPPLGEYLWQQTSQIRFGSPVRAVSGRFRREVVYHERNGRTFCRPYVVPSDPRTWRQTDQRERMSVIQTSWKDLTEEERLGWGRYAAAHLFPERRDAGLGGLGQNAWMKAQSSRLAWGGELGAAPPLLPPPPAPTALEEVAAPEAGQLAFRVEHGLQGAAGYRLSVEMTPPTPNGRKPLERDLRRAAEETPASFFPLAESGAVYLLERPRYAVATGERFALRVRLLTPDGIPGEALMADLIRLEPEEESKPFPATGSPDPQSTNLRSEVSPTMTPSSHLRSLPWLAALTASVLCGASGGPARAAEAPASEPKRTVLLPVVSGSDPPVAAMRIQPGMRPLTERESETIPVVMALWGDGRIVWSDHGTTGGAPYHAARIPEERAKAFVAGLRAREAFNSDLTTYTYVIPDATYAQITIRDPERQQAIDMASAHEIFETNPRLIARAGGVGVRPAPGEEKAHNAAAPESPEEKRFARFRACWGELKQDLLALIPPEPGTLKPDLRFRLERVPVAKTP